MAFPQPAARALRALLWRKQHIVRCHHSSTSINSPPPAPLRAAASKFIPDLPREQVDIEALLSEPSWDPTSLLPPADAAVPPELTPAKLRHLLRLSALPPPRDEAEEAALLSTLAQQLHFVRQVQKVDTTSLTPLGAIRDETECGRAAGELSVEMVRGYLAEEEVRGRYAPRRRRRKDQGTEEDVEWDVLGQAKRKVGRYFVVEKGKA